MDNLELWNKVKQVPPEFLKEIKAGRQIGKSDINPMWRYRAMTERYGPCGIGWKLDQPRFWTEPAIDGQVFAFAEIKLSVKENGEWSEPIPGVGGNMLIVKEKLGLHCNDEAFKMAETDAISVAMKYLGFGADVYAGLWDGSKYRDAEGTKKQATKPANQTDTTDKKPEPPKTKPGDATGREHWCGKHNVAFFKMEKEGKTWYSHKDPDGKWCNEKKKKDESDPWADVRALAKTKGINDWGQLLEALGVEKLSEITPEAGMAIIQGFPDMGSDKLM